MEMIHLGKELRALLIYNNAGLPLFMHQFDPTLKLDEMVFSSLLLTISTIAREIFHQKIATLKFQGNPGDKLNKIVIIAQEMFKFKQKIYFVYFIEGELNLQSLKALSSMIFLEIKEAYQLNSPDRKEVKNKITQIINSRGDLTENKKI